MVEVTVVPYSNTGVGCIINKKIYKQVMIVHTGTQKYWCWYDIIYYIYMYTVTVIYCNE